MTQYLRAYLGRIPLVGAEIGVAGGHNAASMCKVLNMKRLYLIDPYEPYPQSASASIRESGFNSEPRMMHRHRDEFERAKERLARYSRSIVWIRSTSKAAAKEIPDGSLDFCYIDGNHSYRYVREDLRNYWPKVRARGILGGHDLTGNYPGVIRAVIEFVLERDLPFFSNWADFWIVKPNA